MTSDSSGIVRFKDPYFKTMKLVRLSNTAWTYVSEIADKFNLTTEHQLMNGFDKRPLVFLRCDTVSRFIH